MLASIVLAPLGLAPSPQLLALVRASWQRVYAVRAYGRAQQNNHSLIEHLFLVYAAAFLQHNSVIITDAATLRELHAEAPKLLHRLVLPDGGCAMYSTNYHRVFCDMLAFAKIMDDAWHVGIVSQPCVQGIAATMADFLESVLVYDSGTAPLIGHNDGSLHCVQYCKFHDYRPSVLLLRSVFGLPVSEEIAAVRDDVWLFGYAPKIMDVSQARPTEQLFDDFGLLVIRQPLYQAYMKFPRNGFRPSQLDFLHLDVWVKGENVLSDSGTFSYNAATIDRADGLSEPCAHNVPMLKHAAFIEKLSPFLYAFWPKARVRKLAPLSYAFAVSNGAGVVLKRKAIFEPSRIVLHDWVTGNPDWVVAFNGMLGTPTNHVMLPLGSVGTMKFANAEQVLVAPCQRADNYLSHQDSRQTLVSPHDASMPVITTIEFQEKA
jgi:Heparinase II/III-like protein